MEKKKSDYLMTCMQEHGDRVHWTTSRRLPTTTQRASDRTTSTQDTAQLTRTQSSVASTTKTPESASRKTAETAPEKPPRVPKPRAKPYMWEDIEAELFFHGILMETEVERILKQNGDFVAVTQPIRGKEKVVLKVLWDKNMESFPVRQRPEGEYFVHSKCFKTISDLIAYYWAQQETLDDTCKLIRPIRRKFWEISSHEIQVREKMGEARFGEVVKGTLSEIKGQSRRNHEVAVKVSRRDPSCEENRHLFQEVRHWRQFSHPNILKVFGVTTTKRPVMLVQELAAHGGLLHLLQRKGAKSLTLKDRAKYCLEAARGMEYLEKQRYLHNALGARNCLLDSKNVLKLSDYGIYFNPTDTEDNRIRKAKSPIRWQAPETMITCLYTFETDIWSYGILVWEILNDGALPYTEVSETEIMKKVVGGLRMEVPMGTPHFLANVVKACWETPEQRAKFRKIRATIEAGMKKQSMM